MKIFKKWWFWVIVIVIIISASIGGNDTQTTNSTSNSEPQKEEQSKNKPTISKQEFDTIQNGMTYEEVVEIIGSEGEMLSEVGAKGDALYTVMYQWYGEGSLGANANFTFQGGKLEMKAQFGLK